MSQEQAVPEDPTRQTKWSLTTDPKEREWMDRTVFAPDRPEAHCSACGQRLNTEGDFARHFTVPDSRYKNLGNCPRDPKVPWAEVRVGYHRVSDDCVTSAWWPKSLDTEAHVVSLLMDDDVDTVWLRVKEGGPGRHIKRDGRIGYSV